MNLRENQYKKATDVFYKLVAICYANKAYARYPCFKVEHRTVGYFHTLADAERRINELVARNIESIAAGARDEEYYGFVVREIPFDWEIVSDYYSQRTRTYLEDGSFFSETKVSNLGYKDSNGDLEPFKGRDEEECRFREGDLVEVLHPDKVTLEVVLSLPPSTTRVKQIRHNLFREAGTLYPDLKDEQLQPDMGWTLDYSDDSYVTLDGDEGYMANHSHPATIQLFPVRRKVSDRLRDKLLRGWKKVQNDN